MTGVSRVRAGGAVCVTAGLFGAVGNGYLAVTTTVGSDGFSYPQPVAGATGLQMTLALVPAILIVTVFGARWTGSTPGMRRARYGAVVVVAGLTSVGGIAATVPASSSVGGPTAFGMVYACYIVLLAGCLLMAGLEVARGGRWVGWRRWLPFMLGCWLVIAVLPALAIGSAAAGWAMAGWFGLVALVGLVQLRDADPDPSPLVERPRAAASARAAAIVTWVYAAGFGGPAIPITAYLLQNQTLPAFLDLFTMYGGPLWGHVSVGAFAMTLVTFCVLNVLAGWAGWLLWNGSRSGAVLTLVLLPFEAVFWIGFSLPLPWILGAARMGLVAVAWRSLTSASDRAAGRSPVPVRSNWLHPDRCRRRC